MSYPPIIQELIKLFSQLPSVGPKTAERYIFYLLEKKPELIEPLTKHLQRLNETLTTCSICGTIGLSDPCTICQNSARDQRLLCLIASNQDLEAIENTGDYSGRYFILGGYLDTINEIKPEDLRFTQLTSYLRNQPTIKEIILALDPTIEGETTALYINQILKQWPGQITRLARGLSTGANLEYADPLTLANAIKFRQKIK